MGSEIFDSQRDWTPCSEKSWEGHVLDYRKLFEYMHSTFDVSFTFLGANPKYYNGWNEFNDKQMEVYATRMSLIQSIAKEYRILTFSGDVFFDGTPMHDKFHIKWSQVSFGKVKNIIQNAIYLCVELSSFCNNDPKEKDPYNRIVDRKCSVEVKGELKQGLRGE